MGCQGCAGCILEEKLHARACLKNHSCNLHAPFCGTFVPNSVVVAHYDAFIRDKFPTNCDAHLAESLWGHALGLLYKKGVPPRRNSFYFIVCYWENQPSLIAPVGQTSAQVPHSMQESASIT